MHVPLHIVLGLAAIVGTCVYLIHWIRVIAFFNTQRIPTGKVPPQTLEIICAFRNESSHLPSFLDHALAVIQNLPVKIRLIDDQSEDNGKAIIENHKIYTHHSFEFAGAPQEISNKKACLDWAINNSDYPIILTTDADCEIHSESIVRFYHFFEHSQSQLALGLVNFHSENNYLESYQRIENTALIALSTFDANHSQPTMGNAANMMFRKAAFQETDPYREFLHIPGGDDIFLIQAFHKKGFKITYANDMSTSVATEVLKDWKSLWHQRIRWAQKSKFQAFGKTQKSQILFVVYLVFLWGISFYMVLQKAYAFLLLCWCIKLLGEMFFIRKMFQKINQKPPTIDQIFMASILQSLFIPLVAIAQFVVPVRWKDRKL